MNGVLGWEHTGMRSIAIISKRLSILLAILVALAGVPQGTLHAQGGNTTSSIPGLYLTDSENVTVRGDQIEIYSTQNCTRLIGMLRGSEWKMTEAQELPAIPGVPKATPDDKTPPFKRYLAVMRSPDTSYYVDVRGDSDCDALLYLLKPIHLQISGTQPLDGQALVFGMCTDADAVDPNTQQKTDGFTAYLVYSAPMPQRVEFMFNAPLQTGTFDAQVSDGNSTLIVTPSITLLPQAVISNPSGKPKALVAPGEKGIRPVTYQMSKPGPSMGSVEITSIKPVQGTITLNEFKNGKNTITLKADFACTQYYAFRALVQAMTSGKK